MKFLSATARTFTECTQVLKSKSDNQTRAVALRATEPAITSPLLTNLIKSATLHHRVLVVDDDAGIREVLANLLRRSGYCVSCANNGEVGWEALCANGFDMLITDHAMPQLTGLNLLRRVRTGPLNALPVILMSGKMPWEETDLLDLVHPGMAMAKPFSFFELLTSVRSLLPITTHTEPISGAYVSAVFDRPQTPPSDLAWQDNARTRLPSRTLVHAD